MENLSTEKLTNLLDNILQSADWLRTETRFGFPEMFDCLARAKAGNFSFSEADDYYYGFLARYHTNHAVRYVAHFCGSACGHQKYPSLGEHSAGTIRVMHDKAVHYLSNTVVRG